MTPRTRPAVAQPRAPAATQPKPSARPAAVPVNWREFAVPIAVLGIVLAMITPLPPFLLDILISCNITLSVIILLVSLYIIKPVEFSVFPTTLLLMTLFRLALNISSARLILLNGNTGTSAAGEVIQAFGAFVVGGNYVIGVVIFLVLIAIQYVVINHGAVRISEVTARFTLDAMPGKQMAIDSDLNAGLIDEQEARSRRRTLASEAEFYGAMDGASRFTQRDAVASVIITGINILAGFLIGVLQHGMDLQHALQTYTVLTIGDGLVTVIPALMISISGGLIVTRASSDTKLGSDMQRQVFSNPQPLLLAGGVLIAMAAFPGLPKIPFLVLGASVGAIGWRIRQKSVAAEKAKPASAAPPRENLETLLRIEPLAMEVGLGLVQLVEGGQSSPLLKRIASIRKQLVTELGFILPPVRVTDNLTLKAREYVISLKGVEIARYELAQGCELALHSDEKAEKIEGIAAREPAFGIAAVWITPDKVEMARRAGYTVVDSISIMGTHLGEVVRRHAWELFSRQDAKKVLDRVNDDNPKVVEDLVPKLLSLAAVQKVLQNLLRERVSIRDAVSILEALGEAAPITKNTVLLTEYARQAIRRQVVKPWLESSGDLSAYLLDPALEQSIEGAVEHTENSSHVNLSPQRIRDIQDRLKKCCHPPDSPALLVTNAAVRFFVRQIAESVVPNLTVLSHNEIPPGNRIASLGVIA
ncbi:MAG TPA: flagellar biosynthesis protein FlhA [Bryobacteraceae bacterium]|nr:flagellar biosynthesis protein FlhA [Bryobacteraceae bacterium]